MIRAADDIELERPYPFPEVDERAEARCGECPDDAAPHPARELMTVAVRAAGAAEGAWQVYCPEHFRTRESASAPKRPAARRPGRKPAEEPAPTPVCPTCWIAVSLAGVCHSCGETVSA